jgi:hypothetical protein
MNVRLHHIYYLHEKSMQGNIVEVGRSICPRKRLLAKQTKRRMTLFMTLGLSTKNFDKARAMEITEILRLKPKFNKSVQSTRGMFGKHLSQESIQKIRESNTGHTVSLTTRAAVSFAHKGKPLSAEHKAALAVSRANSSLVAAARAAHRGVPILQDHKNKIKASLRAFHDDKKQAKFEEMMGTLYILNRVARAQCLYMANSKI